MSTTEPLPTPRELRQAIAEKLAGLPAGVDANGHHAADRAADAATLDRLSQVVPQVPAEAPARVGMQRGGDTVPAPAPTSPLAAIRAQINHTSTL